MAKVKLTVKELKRISFVLSREIRSQSSSVENIKRQEWSNEQRQEQQLLILEGDVEFLTEIKNKIDIETFGRG